MPEASFIIKTYALYAVGARAGPLPPSTWQCVIKSPWKMLTLGVIGARVAPPLLTFILKMRRAYMSTRATQARWANVAMVVVLVIGALVAQLKSK